jgi:UDP-glucose 4-epimerase
MGRGHSSPISPSPSKKLLKSKSEVTLGESRVGEITRYVADITKAKEALGFDPKVAFKDGIQKSVEWYTRNT